MLVSIIIPMYNSEKYILRCIKSVLIQDYKNIEIIIIDDGSFDRSIKLVNNIKDERINLYKKENGGVSSARNFGIKKANGTFLMFVDADDYVEETIVSTLVKEVKEYSSSLIMCNNIEIYNNRTEKRIIFKEKKLVLNNDESIRAIACGKAGLVCGKLFSRDILENNNILFDTNLKVGEDQLFFINVSNVCNEIKYVNESLYYYDRRNEDSATIAYQEGLIDNFIYLQKCIEDVFYKRGMNSKEDKKILNNKIFAWFLHCLFNEISNKNKKKKIIKDVRIILEKVNKIINIDYVDKKNFIYENLKSCIKKANSFAAFKAIGIVKILKVKNG